MQFKNKTIIITGGTGALGRVVADTFFGEGANIVIPYRNPSSTKSISKKMLESGDRLFMVQTDLTSESQVRDLHNLVVRRFNGIHFLANLAGGYAGGATISEVTSDEWDTMMSLNLKTTFLMCREVLKTMIPQNCGRIINVSAMPALKSGAKKGPYAISKRGVITLTEVIAEEVKGRGITANAIAPSTIVTDANKASMPDADDNKWVTSEEIAQTIAFLCSDNARSISGNVIRIFGKT